MFEHRKFESAHRFQFSWFSDWIGVRFQRKCANFQCVCMFCLCHLSTGKVLVNFHFYCFTTPFLTLGLHFFFDSWCKKFHSLNSKLQQGSVKPNRGQECQILSLCYSHRPLNVWALLFRRIVSLVGAQHLSKLTSACEKARRSRLDGTRAGPRAKGPDSADKTF